jgi:putative ABC transport system permease protein
MIWNHLTAAVRSMRREPGFTAINVAGLAVGIAVCVLITLYVRHELSYDDFHDDADRIYRLVSNFEKGSTPSASLPQIQTIREENASIPVATFLEGTATIQRGDRRFKQNDDFYVAQPEFLDVFTFPVQTGEGKEALKRPYTVLLAPSLAEKYFGETATAVGKTLTMRGLAPDGKPVEVTVAGLLEPIPETSHFYPRAILSWETMDATVNFTERRSNAWGNFGIRAYMKLPEGASPDRLAEQFTEQGKTRARQSGGHWNGAQFSLQKLTDVHLHSHMRGELEPNGSAAYVSVFAVVAVFVLVLACINFINLATARATERAREVGVRKTAGARRGQLIRRYLSEAFVLSVTALALAVGLIAAVLPVFRTITGIDATAGVLVEQFTASILLAIVLLTTLGAGGYPAFVLSLFDPVTVLSGSSRGSSQKGSPWMRKGLVIFQFATAVVLLAGTAVAYNQLNYLQEADLGFDKAQVLTLPKPPTSAQDSRSRAFLQAAGDLPGVSAVSEASERMPNQVEAGDNFGFAGLGLSEEDQHPLSVVGVSTGFFETLGVQILAGRTFRPDRPTDSSAVVLNRAGFERLAQDLPVADPHPREAVGRRLQRAWPVDSAKVVGVVENFHVATLHHQIDPMGFFLVPDMTRTYYLRIDAARSKEVLAGLEEVWGKFYPEAPFTYSFTDQAFAASYRTEQRMSTLFSVFSGLAVFIACLGLLGLAAFMARQRTKEIGIRKAMGATGIEIVRLFSMDFAKLVVAAVAVAIPIAYVALDRWLDSFAYRIELGPGIFLLAGTAALAVALLTVAIQAFRASRIDPAEVLRSE